LAHDALTDLGLTGHSIKPRARANRGAPPNLTSRSHAKQLPKKANDPRWELVSIANCWNTKIMLHERPAKYACHGRLQQPGSQAILAFQIHSAAMPSMLWQLIHSAP
jgi:hypothetical protein